MIPDKGNLNETAPIKLLLAIYEQNQTGILYFRKNEILKVFYLNQGKISWAISSDEEDKIENVLLAKKLLNPEALAPFLAGNKISESFGKILVENGLISLETLINASREQLRRIATSVLFWNSGSYQLETESPPTRLVSLELEIAPLVYNYILTHMDVNIIWEEIGSLAGELQHVSEPEKSFQYSLDAEQQEVFAFFHEAQRPETVLLRFSAERKHTILKILYFLIITGLLVKKKADKIPSIDFDELDKLFGQEQTQSQLESIGAELPAVINEADIKDMSLMDFPDIPDPQSDSKPLTPELPDLIPDSLDEPKDKVREIPFSANFEKNRARLKPQLQEKQKSKWLSIPFLSVLLAAIVGGLFLWFSNSKKKNDESPIKKNPVTETVQKIQEQNNIIPVEQKTEQPSAVKSAGLIDSQNLEPSGIDNETDTEVAKAQEKSQALTNETIPVEKLSNQDSNPRQAFTANDFKIAGKLWQQEMQSKKITHSILLEMDCLKESVQSAYQQITDKENFFILNRDKDGRSCWLVLWGKFRSKDEALQNLKLIPEYFFKQSEPPMVIELEPYL